MAQFILPRGVTGFTSITVSLASFWAYSWKLPHRANGGNLRKSWGICVFLFHLWPTPGCDRLHRLYFLSSEFLHLEVKTPVSGEQGATL